jgi:hypothetical protein
VQHAHAPFDPPWLAIRACLHVEGGRARIARRSAVDPEPRGDSCRPSARGDFESPSRVSTALVLGAPDSPHAGPGMFTAWSRRVHSSGER